MVNSLQLKILAPVGYPWDFSGPRHSEHYIARRRYIPFNKLRGELDGVTIFNPLDCIKADIIHAFNRIPVNLKRFIIGFESHLPRIFGINNPKYEKFLYRQLLSSRCVKIVGISEYARSNFLAAMKSAELPERDRRILLNKLDVRYPSIDIAPLPSQMPILEGEIHFTFVGNHFARKGGCAVVRIAELAFERKLPFVFNIISSLQCGGSIWSDPSREEFYTPYLRLLSLPNIRHYHTLPNREVVRLLESSHFSILTTFADTFGYSAIESMARGTPVICTMQGALPEFVKDWHNGLSLRPAVTPGYGDWRPEFGGRGTTTFERLFSSNVERIAIEVIEKLQSLNNPVRYAAMRQEAYSSALRLFESNDASLYWDRIYEEVTDRESRSKGVAKGN